MPREKERAVWSERVQEEQRLEAGGKKAVRAGAGAGGRRLLGPRMGQAGQNYRMLVPKLLAERPARGRPGME